MTSPRGPAGFIFLKELKPTSLPPPLHCLFVAQPTLIGLDSLTGGSNPGASRLESERFLVVEGQSPQVVNVGFGCNRRPVAGYLRPLQRLRWDVHAYGMINTQQGDSLSSRGLLSWLAASTLACKGPVVSLGSLVDNETNIILQLILLVPTSQDSTGSIYVFVVFPPNSRLGPSPRGMEKSKCASG